jgi:hypothetical protein
MHARGQPKDRSTDMQKEIRGRAKTRYGKPCNTESRVTPKTRSHGNPCDTEIRVFQKPRNSVGNGMPCDSEEHDFSYVYGKTRKHGKSCDTKNRVNRRKHEKPCEPTKTRKSVWRLEDAEIPNSRGSATCSKTSGTRPKFRTSGSLNIRKGGEDRKPMQNRILERKSSAQRRTSGPKRRVRDDDSSANKAQSRRASKPRAQRPQVELEGEC